MPAGDGLLKKGLLLLHPEKQSAAIQHKDAKVLFLQVVT